MSIMDIWIAESPGRDWIAENESDVREMIRAVLQQGHRPTDALGARGPRGFPDPERSWTWKASAWRLRPLD